MTKEYMTKEYMTKEYMTKEYMTKEYMMKKERRRKPSKSQEIDQQASAEVLRHSTTRNRRVEALFRQKGKGASMGDPIMKMWIIKAVGTTAAVLQFVYGLLKIHWDK
ncbi:hypothetical protein HMI51_03605 [Corallococcus coralloides]|nr:hypothetical protein [Corallococcus coralloides]